MQASNLRRVKDMESENSRLKRKYADMALENAAMEDLIAKKTRPDQREAVRCLHQAPQLPLGSLSAWTG